jgi:hypothetical protein
MNMDDSLRLDVDVPPEPDWSAPARIGGKSLTEAINRQPSQRLMHIDGDGPCQERKGRVTALSGRWLHPQEPLKELATLLLPVRQSLDVHVVPQVPVAPSFLLEIVETFADSIV